MLLYPWDSPGKNTGVGSMPPSRRSSHPGIKPTYLSFFFSCNFYFLFIYFLIFYSFIYFFISWRLITLQYCSGFCHTLTWISHRYTCVPHPDPPSHLPLHPIRLGLPSAPGLTQRYRTDFWTLWEKARVGCFKRTASKHVHYLGWNRSPAQVGCMRQVSTYLSYVSCISRWVLYH